MTTEEIAVRLVNLYNEGKALQAEEELYHPEVVSYEQDPTMDPVRGLSAVMAKTKAAFESMETVHKSAADVLFINHDSFLVIFEMDAVFKNGFHMQGKEYGWYRVQDGKVAEEYFYAQPFTN